MMRFGRPHKKRRIALASLLFSLLILILLPLYARHAARQIDRDYGYRPSDPSSQETAERGSFPSGGDPARAGKPFSIPDLADLPPFTSQPFCEVQGGQPTFAEEEYTVSPYFSYTPLDAYGRCGQARACLGKEAMPDGPRENIRDIRPSGWHQHMYDFIEGQALYNRSHLIAYKLGGSADPENLMTGTRFMNASGMLPFEIMIADYIRMTENHVLYRVTPVYLGEELLARGVLLEAESVEDQGAGLSFYVYCYNVQPGVSIDYRSGDNKEA